MKNEAIHQLNIDFNVSLPARGRRARTTKENEAISSLNRLLHFIRNDAPMKRHCEDDEGVRGNLLKPPSYSPNGESFGQWLATRLLHYVRNDGRPMSARHCLPEVGGRGRRRRMQQSIPVS